MNHFIIIKPGNINKNYWSEIWKYKELFQTLAKRDISVRYKQTVIGVAWAIIQPLITMIVLTIIFGKVAKLSDNNLIPYSLIVFSGLLPWMLFSNSLSGASNSLIGNSNLISKVYFPRIIIPCSALMVALVDFLISFLILLALFLYYQYIPSFRILTIPLFTLLAFLASLGPSLLITALTVKYRDFRYIIPFIIQFGLYISPVGFNISQIPLEWQIVYYLNPIVGVIDGFRWAILGDSYFINFHGFAISCIIVILFLFLGIRQFRLMEKTFADII